MTATQTPRNMLSKIRLGRRSPRTVLGGFALLLATGGVAVAAIPGKDRTVKVCIHAATGALRAVDETATACSQDESPRPVQLAATDAAGKVANADSLDGLDSQDFVASRRVLSARHRVPRGSADVKLLHAHGIELWGVCAAGTLNATIEIRLAEGAANVYRTNWQTGSPGTYYNFTAPSAKRTPLITSISGRSDFNMDALMGSQSSLDGSAAVSGVADTCHWQVSGIAS
jgi:hypothetical protein